MVRPMSSNELVDNDVTLVLKRVRRLCGRLHGWINLRRTPPRYCMISVPYGLYLQIVGSRAARHGAPIVKEDDIEDSCRH